MLLCRTTHPDKIVAMASLLILGGVLALGTALVAQYAYGLAPCHFCLLQRYPYGIAILCGVMVLCVPRGGLRYRMAVALGIYALLATAALGLIHTGIESHYLNYQGGCVAQAPADGSLEALRAAIAHAPTVACDAVMAQFLGVSMAGWNVAWAVLLILLIALQYRFDRGRYDAARA